jgi:hypothetical protein
MAARRQRVECRTVVVDGQPVLVRGRGEPSAEAREALTEVIRAAQTLAAELPPICGVRDGLIPCVREPEHAPPHRTRSGREW